MVGLQAAGQNAPLAHGVITMCNHAVFSPSIGQIHCAHQFADGGDYLRGHPPRNPLNLILTRFGVEDVLTELLDGPVFDLAIDLLVNIILYDPGHLVLLIRNNGGVSNIGYQQITEHRFGSDALLG